jgi:hypothetical protein
LRLAEAAHDDIKSPHPEIAGADGLELVVTAPDYPRAVIHVWGRDRLADVLARVSAATGATATLYRNGQRLDLTSEEAAHASVASMVGSHWDLQLDGVRYSINEGRRLEDGYRTRAVNHTLRKAYVLAGFGLAGVVIFGAAQLARNYLQ